MNTELLIGGVVVCSLVVVLQCVAWKLNKNGKVFALTSAVIGGIAGALFGFGV